MFHAFKFCVFAFYYSRHSFSHQLKFNVTTIWNGKIYSFSAECCFGCENRTKFVAEKFHFDLTCNKTKYIEWQHRNHSNKHKLRLSIILVHIPYPLSIIDQSILLIIIVAWSWKCIVMLVFVCLFALFNCRTTLK